MKMTREEAIRNFREHWASLAISGSKDKGDYLRRHGYRHILCNCFLCEYVTNGMERDCNKCPIEWPETDKDMYHECSRSFYGDWERAGTPAERKRIAAIIRDLPERQEVKLKPKFSVGDKVKAVKETNCWGDVRPGDIGVITKVLDGLYVADFPAQKSWHGKEECFELVTEELKKTEYPKELQVEWVGGQPKLKVGDRVRVIKEDTWYGTNAKGKIGIISSVNSQEHPVIKFNPPLRDRSGGREMYWGDKEFGLPAEILELLPINRCPEDKTVTVQTITIEFKGPKTICTIENRFGTFKGRAKCHPTDHWNEKTGADLALERAVEKLNEYQPDA